MASNSADAMDISETVVFKNQNLSDDEQSSHSDGKQVVDPVTTLLQDMGAAPEIASEDEAQEDEDDVYVVEQIVKHRKHKKSKSFEYLVRWEGYGSEDDTWEPHDNIADSASVLVDAYWSDKGGYEQNKSEATSTSLLKRKRQSASADVLTANTIHSKRRRPMETDDQPEASIPDRSTNPEQSRKWSPPLDMKSWENDAVVDTLEKDESNELFVCLEWPKDKQRSRHRADVVYKKMPHTMLKFYEANLVFKPPRKDL